MLGASTPLNEIEKAIFERKDAHYFIFEDTEIKGYIGFHLDETKAELVTVYVPDQYRQQKVASFLLEYGMAWAQQQKVQAITLEVSELNQPAIHLYEKFGFKTIHVRKNYYQDSTDALLMMKEFA